MIFLKYHLDAESRTHGMNLACIAATYLILSDHVHSPLPGTYYYITSKYQTKHSALNQTPQNTHTHTNTQKTERQSDGEFSFKPSSISIRGCLRERCSQVRLILFQGFRLPCPPLGWISQVVFTCTKLCKENLYYYDNWYKYKNHNPIKTCNYVHNYIHIFLSLNTKQINWRISYVY